MKLWVRSLASLSGYGSSDAMSCGVGLKRGSDPALLWLWCRPGATALTQPLAWELPYTARVALKSKQIFFLIESLPEKALGIFHLPIYFTFWKEYQLFCDNVL